MPLPNRAAIRSAVALAALAAGLAQADDAPRLTAGNFVVVGDQLTEVLDTTGLALSTMMFGDAASIESPTRAASFRLPGPGTRDTRPVTRRCVGGGRLSLGADDADGSGDLSAGDSFRLDFDSCVVDGRTVSGRSDFTVAAHRFEGSAEITELEFRFSALGSAAQRWTGSAHAQLRTDLIRGTESYRVRYRDLVVSHGTQRMRWNFALELTRPPIGEDVASVGGPIAVDGLELDIRQDQPFVIGAGGSPRLGQLTARDTRGARLQLEGGRHRYAYRFFVAGNGGETPDSKSQSKPHAQR